MVHTTVAKTHFPRPLPVGFSHRLEVLTSTKAKHLTPKLFGRTPAHFYELS